VSQPGPGEPEVFQITDAMTSHSDDLEARMAKYLVSMLVRTVCVLMVFVVDGWLRWVFIAGAVGLPYVAVIVANNSGRSRGRPQALGTPASRRPGLAGTSRPATGAGRVPAEGSAPVVLTGVVQPHAEEPPVGPLADAAPRLDDAPEPLRDSA